MRLTHRNIIRGTIIAGMTALLSGLGPLGAQNEPATAAVPAQGGDRGAAMQHAIRLRAEAAEHREMEKTFAGLRAASRRERQWNARVVKLCHEYAADAETAAVAYDALAAQTSSTESSKTQMLAGEHAIVAPPVTAEEYKARAADYERRAAEFRADADRHDAMIRQNPRTVAIQTYRAGPLPQRTAIFESPRDLDLREHCIEIVRQSTDLARDADDFAKHYALRARQLAVTK